MLEIFNHLICKIPLDTIYINAFTPMSFLLIVLKGLKKWFTRVIKNMKEPSHKESSYVRSISKLTIYRSMHENYSKNKEIL